jgi:predicted RNase H-like HicB family nuclease
MNFTIEIEQEADGRWIAEVVELPCAMSYGANPKEARAKAQALALSAIKEQMEHGSP